MTDAQDSRARFHAQGWGRRLRCVRWSVTVSLLPCAVHQHRSPTHLSRHTAAGDCVCWLAASGFAINAAVAFERQLAQMFFPLLSLATIVRSNPYYPKFNASFDAVAKELLDEVRCVSQLSQTWSVHAHLLIRVFRQTG